MKTGSLQGFHWVADAQYMVVPKGVSPEKRHVLYELMKYMLTKEAQAQTWIWPASAGDSAGPRHWTG